MYLKEDDNEKYIKARLREIKLEPPFGDREHQDNVRWMAGLIGRLLEEIWDLKEERNVFRDRLETLDDE